LHKRQKSGHLWLSYIAQRVTKSPTIMKHAILASLLLMVLSVPLTARAEEYSRNRDFGPIRLTTIEAAKLANDLLRYVQSVNDPARNTNGIVALESPRYDATFDLPISPDDIEKSPDRAFSLAVLIRSSGNKIDYVNLTLRDGYRSVKVSGLNLDHVTGLLSLVTDKLEAHTVSFSGPRFRFLLGVGFYLLLLFGYMIVYWRSDFGLKVFAISLFAVVVLSNGVIYFFQWDRIFPGTLVTRNEMGFLDKYAPLFTLLSFLLAIVVFAWQVILARRNKRILPTS